MILYVDQPRSAETVRGAGLPMKDRCDQCGQPPFVKAVKEKKELVFCLHDGRVQAPLLADNGWTIEDSTYLLLKDRPKPVVDESPLETHIQKDDGGSGVMAKAL